MPDWTKSMQQTYEYYTVDPGTWRDVKRIEKVKSCEITRDISSETLGSANLNVNESLGECYVRAYLITIQNGIREKHPLGTFLVQTPSTNFDGKVEDISIEAYTPLLELGENPPPIGYSILKGENVMDMAYLLSLDNMRAPVVKTTCDVKLHNDFISDTSDTWLKFISDLMNNAKYYFMLDEMGRVLFAPKQDTASMQPVWTYDDSNSSILYPEISVDRDMYGIPNVVEVVYSRGNGYYYAKAVNDDPNSPISTVNRGRTITHRVTDPDLIGDPTENQIDEYAKQTLRDLSALEYTVTYKHGYCPVRIGDCVRLDYAKAGLSNVKARVISQNISCEPGCPVSETAVFTTRLWG